MRDLLLVGIGGLLGAISRFVTTRWLTTACPFPSHIATVIINTAGSLLLGLLVARATGSGQAVHGHIFLTVGFCGSFTTFSSWILDISSLARQAPLQATISHVIASLILGVAAFALGMLLGQRWGLSLHLSEVAQRLGILDKLVR